MCGADGYSGGTHDWTFESLKRGMLECVGDDMPADGILESEGKPKSFERLPRS